MAFDDGLYAAVGLLAQDGTPRLPGKRHLLEQVRRILRAQWQPTSQDPRPWASTPGALGSRVPGTL